ncbi:MAG: response regulator [Phycisphaerae bacterium]
MTPPVTILLVDDHQLVRGTLAERLEREAGLRVVGGAADAEEAVEQVRRHRPDIILMDIDMPGMSSFEAARTISSFRPESRIIFLSAYTHDRYIQQALEVRAAGYLTKRESPETVIEAILEACAGGAYFSPEVQDRIVVDSSGARLATEPKARIATLTRREREVLQYLARGLGKREIAESGHISVKTVDTHCTNLMRKLDIHNRVELARFAIREGLASP